MYALGHEIVWLIAISLSLNNGLYDSRGHVYFLPMLPLAPELYSWPSYLPVLHPWIQPAADKDSVTPRASCAYIFSILGWWICQMANCTMPFYVRDLAICGFGILGMVEPIPEAEEGGIYWVLRDIEWMFAEWRKEGRKQWMNAAPCGSAVEPWPSMLMVSMHGFISSPWGQCFNQLKCTACLFFS